MATVVDLSSALSRKVIDLLEKPHLGITAWVKKVEDLEEKHGPEIYRTLIYVLTNLDFPLRRAKSHWKKLVGEWVELREAAGSRIDLRVAALHYFLQTQKKLKNPTVVEIKFLQKAQGSAIVDELTRSYNYRYFQDRVDQEVKRAHRYGRAISLLMVDVDDFKIFNDRNGHLAGNTALRKLTQIFKRCVRDVDVVCRYGGEEFAVILPTTPKQGALVAAEKIRLKVEESPIRGEENQPKKKMTVSVGVATVPSDAATVVELVERADAALYRAKAMGKNRVEAFSDERREYVRYDAELGGRLRALEEDALPIRTSNISQGGFLITTNQAFPVGSLLQLELSMPRQRKPLTCTARVVRVEENEHAYEIGVKIIHLEGEDRYRLQRYIKRLERHPTVRSRPKKAGVKVQDRRSRA